VITTITALLRLATHD